MNPKKSRTNRLSRGQILTFLMFGVMAIFVLRLAQLQLFQGKYYAQKATAMQISRETINPVRGDIFVRDADGELAPLVLNQTVYTLFVDPSQTSTGDVAKIQNLVNSTLSGDSSTTIVSSNFSRMTDKSSQYLVLARNVSYNSAQKIKKGNFSELGLQATSQRVYPEGNLASQVLGYVNNAGQGQYGVEQYLNKQLTGTPGMLQSVVSASQVPLTIDNNSNISKPATNGTNYVLTIDRNIQYQAEQALQTGLKNASATSGSVMVMDPQTGRVLAMASEPSYDPSNLNSITMNSSLEVSTAEALPVTSAYEPGSIMKLFTIAAGVNNGNISANSTFNNTNCIQIDDAKICNVDKVPGTRNMMQILGYSLNVGAVWVLGQMSGAAASTNGTINLKGRTVLYDYLTQNYRFSDTTGIQIAGESNSTIHPPDMVDGPNVTYADMTFGQGMQLTMAQVLGAFSAIVNGGTYYQPTVILGTTDSDGTTLKQQASKVVATNVVSAATSASMVGMLHDARYQYASGAAANDNGYYVGGKTGTAQKIDPNTGKYSDTLTTGSYIGFGAQKNSSGQETPKYVILVRVDDAKTSSGEYSGAAAAEPIFNTLSNFMIQYEGMNK